MHNPVAVGLRPGQGELRGRTAVGEQALPCAARDRVDEQVQFVDQAVREHGPDQRAAPADVDVAVHPVLEITDAVRTVRAECLDWTLVLTQRQLSRVLTEYLQHYSTMRPHRSLDLQPPRPTRLTLVEPAVVKAGIVETPVQRVDVLGGLIHEYRRAA